MRINTDPEKIEEVLTRGVERIYPSKEELKKILLSGKRIKVYCGYDPTAPTLHLGHSITLLKLAQFQELGHRVIMLIGDFTGMIGDPTEKLSPRKKLTRKEVLANSKRYKKIASRVLNFYGKNPARVLYNSQWNDRLNFLDLIEMASNFTVQRMIARDFFQERIKKKRPIFLHEFLYPLAQAFDSVAMDVDLEIGGRDQIFNMLCGRDLMKILKKKEKFVLATKLLVMPEGKKMGKTEKNIISLDEDPNQIYGKIMAWPDSLIEPGLELCADLSLKEIKKISSLVKRKKMNPKEAKSILAKEVVKIWHGKGKAERAEREFERIFREKKLPTKIPSIEVSEKNLSILDLLMKAKLVQSKSEAKRLILQRGVKINGKLEKDWRKVIEIKKGMVIQVGKRRFSKII